MPSSLFFEPWIGADYQRLREQRDLGVLQPDVWAHPFHVLGSRITVNPTNRNRASPAH